MPWRKVIVPIYLVVAFGGAHGLYMIIGKDLLPKTNTGQLQLRVREPDGTRLEVTEKTTKGVLASSTPPSWSYRHFIGLRWTGAFQFRLSNLYIFNSGTHESVIQVNLDEDYKVQIEDLKEELRKNILGENIPICGSLSNRSS
jgi:multidrug efflux pump subunit AcrB